MPRCKLADVSEHDMDLLFLEEFVVSQEFLNLFTAKVGLLDTTVIEIEHSKTHPEYGESDMTVIVEANGTRYGLLIEDKIDAIAMPEQHERYVKRGKYGMSHGDYSKFFVFIVAPEKYLKENAEAQKYPNKISYEECVRYFETDTDRRKAFKLSQINQAINKQKTGYQVIENDAVTKFWRELQKFCEGNFPSLYLSYDGSSKGSSSKWFYFKTPYEKVWIIYKSNAGEVVLEFQDSNIRKKITPLLEKDMILSEVGKSYGVLIHKNKWKISLNESFANSVHIIAEVLEQVTRLVDLVQKSEH